MEEDGKMKEGKRQLKLYEALDWECLLEDIALPDFV